MELLRKLITRVRASVVLALVFMLSMGAVWGAAQPNEPADAFWFLIVGVLVGGMAVFQLKLGTRVTDEKRRVMRRIDIEVKRLNMAMQREMEGIRTGLKREIQEIQAKRGEANPTSDSQADSDLQIQLTNRLDHLTQVIGRSSQARLSTQIELTEHINQLRQAIDDDKKAGSALGLQLGERIDRLAETVEHEQQARHTLKARLISLESQSPDKMQHPADSVPTEPRTRVDYRRSSNRSRGNTKR